jgi:ABC-type transport system involved in cytochrome bd biosynthesis fused ATPase/permease subunit
MSLLTDRRWRTALALALVASLSGVLLVGVSAWFLGAVALAGLGPAAYAFAFHHPAAIVRLLALLRTTAKYGERVTGHAAALRDQTEHRGRLFGRMADAAETRAQGWQLARTDRLQAFLGDVEQVDFAKLRVALPLVTAGGALAVISLLTFRAVPLALPAVLAQGAFFLLAGLCLASLGDGRMAAAEAARRRAGEALGQQLAGLPSLEGGAERAARVAESIAWARKGEAEAAAARLRLGAADALLSALGPLAAMLTLVVAANTGLLGEAALPSLLTAFAWLALGELIAPLARARFAQLCAARAKANLATWQDEKETADRLPPSRIGLHQAPLRDPSGRALGPKVSLTAAPGAPAALLGPSGCGKTTLLKEIAGWLPWAGATHPLGSEAIARASCPLSLHDAAILDGTVRDNLFSEADDTALWSALDAAELTERVREAGGLDARVTQNGLSLGEARRIALARAFLTQAPVILLDEPGEHLGAAQATRILKRLLLAQSGRSILLVTHEARLAALATSQETVR